MTELETCLNDTVNEFSLNGDVHVGKIVSCYDADTVRIVILFGDKLTKFNCRLMGIDTPEMKPSRSKPNRIEEKKKAKLARNRLVQLATSCNIEADKLYKKKEIQRHIDSENNKLITVKCFEFDKYGRLLIEICENTDSKPYNYILVDEGHAKPYDGGTKDPW